MQKIINSLDTFQINDLYYNNNENQMNYINKPKTITINENINCIGDLIQLTNLYPIDNNITYNIDMITIHNIKDELIELNSFVGMKNIKQLITYQILYYLQKLNNDNDFMHIVLSGPPGTGKTEISKCIGKLFSKLGILSKGTYKKVTRADLIAGYLGQTAIKTKKVVEESIGGVLFIDEAYSLGHFQKDDSFSKECLDMLNELLSVHKNDLMVIIAGYESELNDCFFRMNSGLRSRFPWKYNLEGFNHIELCSIFVKKVNDEKWSCTYDNDKLIKWFKKNINCFPSYGRDIEVLFSKIKISHAKRIFGLDKKYHKVITYEDIIDGFDIYKMNKDKINENIAFNMYT